MPTSAVILKTQESLILKWSKNLSNGETKFQPRDIPRNHATIEVLVDEALKGGILQASNDQQVNDAILYAYSESAEVGQWGALPSTIKRSYLETQTIGQAYRDECQANGVPVPDWVNSPDWVNHGVIGSPFISTSLDAELWSWESTNPAGVCLSLPRMRSDGKIMLFSVICMGKQTGKVCHFDNPVRNGNYPKWEPYPDPDGFQIQNFIGGADLASNGGGTCSDCHAGANPFIIHPDDPVFQSLESRFGILAPARWPDHIVPTGWVNNPGPMPALPQIPQSEVNAGSCEGCHLVPGRGFPIISQALPGYCRDVLKNAIGNTMPPLLLNGDPDTKNYRFHSDYLKSLCDTPPNYGNGSGTIISNPPSNLNFLSPPLVFSPIYECSDQIGIRGARLNATVDVFVDGNLAASVVVRSPSYQVVNLPKSLISGQEVTAVQSQNGVTSGVSNRVIVRHYSEDYPDGLPEPVIDPRVVHECAHNIAVRHVPGAKLRVYTNSVDRAQGGDPSGYSVARGEGPFDTGDELFVKQELCGDESPASDSVYTRSAPQSLPQIQMDPDEIFDEQELLSFSSIVEGATLYVEERSVGLVGSIFSWPLTWKKDWDFATPFGGPLSPANVLRVTQSLCTDSPPTDFFVTKGCEELDAPILAPLVSGQDFVIVTNAAPGASVRIYDANGDEIGDGGAPLILLSRPLIAYETITAVQELSGECISDSGRTYSVSEGEGQTIGGE